METKLFIHVSYNASNVETTGALTDYIQGILFYTPRK